MTVLNIYSLDDTENENVIACLPEGKHIIGRGDLLQVTDKRVSRKHAVIDISSDKIYLTSVHVNPCFFKAAMGKTLSVLSQNQQSELNDGDQFALLPETCWFKVKIKKEDQPLNGFGESTFKINNKRNHDNDTDEDSKRPRLSTASTHETSLHNSDNSATTSNVTLEISNNVQSETSHDHQENEKLGKNLQKDNEELYSSLNLAETARITDEPDDNDDIFREIKEESIEPGNDKSLNDPSASTSNVKIKEEHVDNTNNEGDKNENDFPPPYNDTSNDQQPEGDKNENDLPPPNNDTSNDQQPKVKAEDLDDEDDQNKDGASGSGTGPKKVRREKCWYGERCFRKNPNHRDTFSHPGDQDYESDPDDDRPDCPFGASCYRKNIDHRREYKHTGKPAAKPRPRSPSPNSPASPTVQNTPPNQKKPRKAATKKPKPPADIDSSQDDYDLEDPFINDGSSDDFQPSGIDSDSSDWDDSQEVDEESQERNRMLREAKKFTKKGKKK